MKHFFISILALSCCFIAEGQQNYAVSQIPKPLLIKAGAVVRLSQQDIKVNNLSDISLHQKKVITILNESQKDEAEIALYYNKTTQIKSIKGLIYNEFGIPGNKFSEKNFNDYSAVSNFSLYEDDRVKHYQPAIETYPCTIEYDVEFRLKQSLYFPTWQPVTSEGVSIEKALFTVSAPADMQIRHKEDSFKGSFKEQVQGSLKSYEWSLENIGALAKEPYQPGPEKVLPMVKVAAETFEFKGIKGHFAN